MREGYICIPPRVIMEVGYHKREVHLYTSEGNNRGRLLEGGTSVYLLVQG